jgi:TPR repeat protein
MIDNGYVPYDKLSAARTPFNRDERIENYMTSGTITPSVNKVQGANQKISAGIGQINTENIPENPYDQILLGRRYELGQNQEQNINMALQWYEKAANADHPLAQEILGNIYAGINPLISPDPVLALKWLAIAASNPKAGENTSFYAQKAAETEKNLSFADKTAATERIKLWKAENRPE